MGQREILTRIKRLGVAGAAFLFGDRASLRPGGPGPIARLFGVRGSTYRPHPYTLYELNPEWRSADGRARHNALGFRGAEVSPKKPAGRIRIVCMGESTTYCAGIEDDNATYPARVEAHLRARRPDLDIEVVNAGVAGYTSIENLLRYHFHIAPLSPDLVVFYYTHNDVHPRRFPHLSCDYREYSRSWYEPPFGGGLRGWVARRRNIATGNINNLVRRYDEFAGHRQAANIANNAADAFRANVTALALLARHAGVQLLLVNPPYRDLWKFMSGNTERANPAYLAVFEHRCIIEDIGERLGCAIYDLARDMPYPADPKAFPNEYYMDSVHVNEKGADLMGRLVAEAVIAANLIPATTSSPGRDQ